MKQILPKIIAAHDLSGLGTASLGAVIPILSSMGAYVCPLPTAVLSTITGVYENFTMTDLTEQMANTIHHWSTLDVSFDVLYSGFLGSPHQVDMIVQAAKQFDCCLVVDPVFADHGALYPTMDEQMVQSMRHLVSCADVITPNMTEAQFLLDEAAPPQTLADAFDWCRRLSDMGPTQVAITSCAVDGKMYVCAYDKKEQRSIDLLCRYLPGSFHGTGDTFTSVLVGALASGERFEKGLQKATEFVRAAIEETLRLGISPREGIAIERVLPLLQKPCC